MRKIRNEKNGKIHYLSDAHTTLCGMNDAGIEGFERPQWVDTEADVDCKLCLRRVAADEKDASL
jgi:hypothetical protein